MASLNADEENKSLLSKAKDTLMGLTNEAMKKLFKYSDPNKFEIKGMSKSDFDATKVILESKLRLKGMKGVNTYPKYFGTSYELWCKNESLLSESKLSTTTMDIDIAGNDDVDKTKLDDNITVDSSRSLSTKTEASSTTQETTLNTSSVLDKPLEGSYAAVKKEEWMQPPVQVLTETIDFKDDKKDEMKLNINDRDEIHVLPTIKIEQPPKIIEREIEYIKPVEIKQTIVHQEQPIIVEKPIIKEKFEHYRDETQTIKSEKKIVKEINSNINESTNNEQELIENLKKERLSTYENQLPIIEHQKEKIALDTEYREQPTIVNSKQTVYQQPIEIEQKYIEKVKPVVNENITINKEHVFEKLAPEHYVSNAQEINKGDEFYSKDSATVVTNDTSTTSTSTMGTKSRQEEFVAGKSNNEQRSL